MLPQDLFPFKEILSIQWISEGSNSAGLHAERFAAAEVTRHRLSCFRVNDRGTVGARINTGLATDTPLLVRHHGSGFLLAFPCLSGTDGDTRGIFTVLTEDGEIESNFPPFLHLNPGEG